VDRALAHFKNSADYSVSKIDYSDITEEDRADIRNTAYHPVSEIDLREAIKKATSSIRNSAEFTQD